MLLPVLAAALRTDEQFVAFTVVVSALILWRHKDNMIRLWNGTEPKIGQRREQGV
jgi:glycerol-3-phosphate acyltransferase PlsY